MTITTELKVGTHVNLRNWATATSTPFTVIEVNGRYAKIRECDYIFPNPRYYDTKPLVIMEGEEGNREETIIKCKHGWKKLYSDYLIVEVGEWCYEPYCD